MKRVHIHIAVNDLAQNIQFYSTLFGSKPSVEHNDYAKWQLDDPAINLAISSRDNTQGINHLGIQVDSDQELATLSERLQQAQVAVVEQKKAECCYATSNKHWTTDPQGIAWESFHSLNSIPTFGTNAFATNSGNKKSVSCCIPSKNTSGCCS